MFSRSIKRMALCGFCFRLTLHCVCQNIQTCINRMVHCVFTSKGPSFSKTCAVVRRVIVSDRPGREGGIQGTLSGCKTKTVTKTITHKLREPFKGDSQSTLRSLEACFHFRFRFELMRYSSVIAYTQDVFESAIIRPSFRNALKPLKCRFGITSKFGAIAEYP